ncbi:MAG: hypothetical protein E7459_01875 [Ruminococcaceae bacterium]|nr:hypothetical protein [Oscillospiraceae bacterium]
MIFITIEDFYQKAASCQKLTREEEIHYATQMNAGDCAARQKLIESYLPMVAGYVKRTKPHMQTLVLALYCLQALERAVDSFDFLQDRESFTHRLSWWLRQAVTSYIARR